MVKISRKKVVNNQKYEDYWKLTMEYTDIYGERFNNTLSTIVNFIDSHQLHDKEMNSEQYQELTSILNQMFSKKDNASTRKAINQFFKLGFLNNNGEGYHRLTKSFLTESNLIKKKNILSKVMYSNASFSRTYSNKSSSNEVSFFIKTLENIPGQKLSFDQLKGLMTVNMDDYEQNFINEKELNDVVRNAESSGFSDRKYNQVGYTNGMFKKLEGVFHSKNIFSLSELVIQEIERKVRDPYLQSLYKLDLVEESKELYGIAQCYLEKLPHKSLIASHIKPFIVSDEDEAYDVNNGLLLSRNTDALFDLGYITFDEEGKILFSDMLNKKLIEFYSDLTLDKSIYNEQRKKYMKYHRENVFNKLKK